MLHRVVMVQLVIDKLEAGCTEGTKAAGMKAIELFGGYNSILSIARSRSVASTRGTRARMKIRYKPLAT